ncbi:MAG: glycosyl hydrolase family 65 protein [Catalinimonas sp.]
MRFGYFDDERREYVIDTPNTPKSWSNYLGSTEYGAIITNNAGGYSFYKSGGMGRFMRMRFNSVPMDQPGRYVYLHDHADGNFWSTSWQPVGKPLDQYKSVCRHGMAYSVFESEYSGVKSEVTYFVPLGKTYEVWRVKITNDSDRPRTLSAFTYTELVGSWNAIDDLLNLQYVQYTPSMKVVDGIIDHGTNVNIPAMPDNFKEKDQGRHTFHALAGADVASFDTDREAFLGDYRTYADPQAVAAGTCSGSVGYGDNPCASLQTTFELPPGETKEFAVIIGIGTAEGEGAAARAAYADLGVLDGELQALKDYWYGKMGGFSAQTPDGELNSTVNTWGIYNSLITFAWSRAASLVYSGVDRDGLGYRDTVQDFLGVMHAITDETRERLELMITGQNSTGGAMPVVLPISHQPGQEEPTDESAYRSDDCLWLFNAVPAYVKETGDLDFYRKVLPYSDAGEATVFGHLRRAIEFNLERSGNHGLPCGLHADWNDCLKFGHTGESVFVAMQLRYALATYIEIAQRLGDADEEAWAQPLLVKLDENLQKHAWDGDWFLRGYRQDGMKFGAAESDEGKIFLNPQVWAVISGAADGAQARRAMDAVHEHLATDYGLQVCDPPYTRSDWTIVRAQLMNPGLKENGGIFIHTQGWGVMAEAMLGRGNRAYQYLRAYLPAAYNEKADVREIEPYVVCQSTHSRYSPKHGASRLPWLSGSATWTFYAISQYVLGIQPDYAGLRVDPCVPDHWDKFSVQRTFRGKRLNVRITNPDGVQKGIKSITVNGEAVEGNLIPTGVLGDHNEVEVVMG